MVTPEQVAKLVADRPKKFSAKEVAFLQESDDPSQTCAACFRWYQSNIAQRAVCEIYAPDTEDRNVPAGSTCAYFTVDGLTYPRQKAKTKSNPENRRDRRTLG